MEVNKKISNTRLYFLIMKMSLKGRMSFRLDFIVMLVSVFLRELASLALLYIVTERFDMLNGWSKWDMSLLYCMVTFCHRMFCSFFGGVIGIWQLVISGEMDSYLLTPRSPLFLINARNTMVWRVFYNIPLFIVLVISAIKAGIGFTLTNTVLFIVFILSSVIIMFAIYLFIATISIFVVNAESLERIFTDVIQQFMVYPISIFGKVAAFILTFFIPLGFIAYYPSSYLLGLNQHIIGNLNLGILTPIVAVSICSISLAIWRFGIKRYNSTGT